MAQNELYKRNRNPYILSNLSNLRYLKLILFDSLGILRHLIFIRISCQVLIDMFGDNVLTKNN